MKHSFQHLTAPQCCCVWNLITGIELVSHLVSFRLEKLLAVKYRYFNGLKPSEVLSVFCFCFFSSLTQNVYVNINRIMSVGNRLLESGHYASQQIQQISGQLEQEWKAFAAALDERSTLLEMSASFHQKADQVQAEKSTSIYRKVEAPLPHICTDSCHNV